MLLWLFVTRASCRKGEGVRALFQVRVSVMLFTGTWSRVEPVCAVGWVSPRCQPTRRGRCRRFASPDGYNRSARR